MQWDILNTEALIPLCKFCNSTTNQMARFWLSRGTGFIYICSDCARSVKEAMNKWKELESIDHIVFPDPVFDHKIIDKVIQENKDKASLFPEVDPDDEMKATIEPLSDDPNYDWRIKYHKGQKP
jgi:hypothetical protein